VTDDVNLGDLATLQCIVETLKSAIGATEPSGDGRVLLSKALGLAQALLASKIPTVSINKPLGGSQEPLCENLSRG
jgi:hypothetical protein